MLTAITRELNADFADCQLTHLPRVPIDLELARRQHQQYQAALASLGCEVTGVPTEPGLPDSVFIEDTALVLDEIAVLCRPGASARQGEVTGVEHVLQRYRPLASVQTPGTVDGGDLLHIDTIIFAGLSKRTNEAGIDQLRELVSPYGYAVSVVAVEGCLHLKSAVSQVGPGTLLINPEWVDPDAFAGFDRIEVDPQEPHAANALLIGDTVLFPSAFPRTREKLVAHGIKVLSIGVSELQKAEGGVTCCSLVVPDPD